MRRQLSCCWRCRVADTCLQFQLCGSPGTALACWWGQARQRVTFGGELWKGHCAYLCYCVQWTQLKIRKQNLTRLFEKMQAYQYEQISADPDKPLADGIRALDTTDMERYRPMVSGSEVTCFGFACPQRDHFTQQCSAVQCSGAALVHWFPLELHVHSGRCP